MLGREDREGAAGTWLFFYPLVFGEDLPELSWPLLGFGVT